MESDFEPSGSQRLPAASSDILDGPLNRPLLRLALPMMAGFLFQIGFNYVDSFYVAYLGQDALAAVGAIMFVSWALMSVAEVVTVGTLALVARAVGARDPAEGGAVAGLGAALTLVLSLVTGGVGWLIAEPLVATFGLEPEPARLAVGYMQVLVLGYPALAGFLCVESIFRGAGETALPMVVLATIFLINIALDRVLIFGFGPIPAYGVNGAAAATVISRTLGCVVLGALLLRSHQRLGLEPPRAGWADARRLVKIVRIGGPASAAGLSFCAIYLVLLRITSEFGTEAVAALTLGLRLESLPFFTCLALGRAAATMAGQCMGAKDSSRARRASRRAVWLGLSVVVPLALVMAFAPEACMRVFIDEPAVVVAGAAYLRILSWCMPLLVVEIVLGPRLRRGSGSSVSAGSSSLGARPGSARSASLFRHRPRRPRPDRGQALLSGRRLHRASRRRGGGA